MLTSRLVAIALFAALLLAAPFHAALAQTAPDLGTAGSFAVLGGTAVTLTNSAVIGDVGSPVAVTVTGGTVAGTVYPVPNDPTVVAAYNDAFVTSTGNLSAYDALAAEPCPTGNTLDTVYTDTTLTLLPGVYCNDAAVTFTRTTLTLDAQGDPNAVWIFKIGTLGTGALTGTSLSVVMAKGGNPCNVYWWVKAAAAMTDSTFLGTILAGAAIAGTRGTFNGEALAQAAVTMTDTAIAVCGSPVVPPPVDFCKQHCEDLCNDHDKGHGKDHWNDYCNDYWNDYWNNHWKNYWKDHDKNHDNRW
jgi:hypothetical protein